MNVEILDKNYIKILIFGLFLRLFYLVSKVGDLTKINLGGDPCHHYNIAYNLSKFVGPKTNFIFSYWHHHEKLPALTDTYLPGFHIFASIFLFFSDSFLVTRFITILIYVINFIIIILIAKKLNNRLLGYITCFLISLNYFHIENSTVFMTVNFYCLIFSIFIYLYLLSIENNNYYFLLGFIISYSSITSGGWQILLIISLISIFIKSKTKIRNLILLILGFAPIYIFWSYYTNKYFGSSYYSNLNFYPFVNGWANMLHSLEKPSISEFISSLDLLDYLYFHLKWGILNLFKLSITTFPSFIFFLGVFTLPLIFYSASRFKVLGIPLISIIIFYTLGIFFASYGLSGILWPRHFVPILFPISILLAYSFIEIAYRYQYISVIKSNFNIILIICSCVMLFLMSAKSSFWIRDSAPLFELGNYIKENDINNIMYGLTVQDLWCVSKKNIIMDPVFQLSLNPERAADEINHYGIKYLLIDLSSHIYDRSQISLEEAIKNYNHEKINLNLIYEDKINKYYLYKIE